MNLFTVIPFLYTVLNTQQQEQQPVYLALKQHNIDVLEKVVNDISNPISENYGKVMKMNEIVDIISPTYQEQQQVISWISEYNISDIKNYGDNIKFQTSKDKIRQMFNISTPELYNYTIPYHLRDIIDFVEMSSYKVPRNIKINNKSPLKTTDDRYFGREPMMYLYNVSDISLNHSISGASIEYQHNGGFINNDLTKQQVMNGQIVNILNDVVGPNEGIDVESSLDVQMMSQAGNNAKLWFWDTPIWLYSFAVNFYNTPDIPDVISMSWGWSQANQCDIVDCSNLTSLQYVNRVNIEYMKIVLRGTTMTVSSGDAGAPGRTNEECNVNNPINPVFPGSSPFVVSVGATYTDKTNKKRDYKSPLCLNNACITDNNEKSISFDHVSWTAGGGFDLTRNSTPWWQKSVVDKYLNSGVQLPPDTNFNRNGRAYPDVSAIGHSCPTYINGQLGGVDGTSCSSPVVAGLLTIIKEHLWKTKKIKIGHINPLLYYVYDKCPSCYRDITEGYNWCTEETCSSNTTYFGFNATRGFDPVSGLGTLNIGNILWFIENKLENKGTLNVEYI